MSRWQALAVLCAGTLMIIVDQTIVSVALPAIRADLGFTESGLAWVVNAYVIPFGGLLLLAGRLGDLVGRKRLFVLGMAVFTVSSLWCGLAPSAGWLVAARFTQGIGGALASAVMLGMVVPLFPEAAARARALGVVSFVQATGGALGSLLGGVLTESVAWPWIFYINIPIGVVTVVCGAFLPADRGVGGAADVLGGALATGGLMLAVSAIVNTSWQLGAAAVVLLALFVVRESRYARPLLPLRAVRSVAGVNVVLALLVAAMFGFLFFAALYLRSRGNSALTTGLSLVPIAVAIGVVSLWGSARLIGRFGERIVLLSGLVLIVAGLLLVSVAFLPATVVLGVGFGLAMPALMALGMAKATTEDAGLMSGLFNTSQQVGGALGLSVLVAVTNTYQEAFLWGAGLVTAAFVVAISLRGLTRTGEESKLSSV